MAVSRFMLDENPMRRAIAIVVDSAGMDPQTIPRTAPAALARSSSGWSALENWVKNETNSPIRSGTT